MEPILFEPVASPHLVPHDGSFRVERAATCPPDDAPGKKENQRGLEEAIERIAKAQAKLYADDRYAVLIVFQALDAAGKDGTQRAVLSGINPAGCEVTAFKAPNSTELDHDFMWRCSSRVPARGIIGVWNRSHYEEVLVVRANPGFLRGQHLPRGPEDLPRMWRERYESINDHERHWARNGVVVLKFWLNVSRAEQRKRLLERIDTPEANWKFNPDDLAQRAKWDEYMAAYQDALNATSRPWAPWYTVPSDS
jgi:PPK2 family polyphosphate:nucleotide phosphotransferase